MGTHRVKTTQTPMSFTPLAAVQERYKFPGFLCVSIASLRGIAVRPLPCNYNVLQLVCALSRRKRGFKSRRGRHLFNGLQMKPLR